jgi:2-polyprenyl-3-methyl-5-hydroxy-6-metoxy-1,4-benzoquinol methylase
MRAHELMSDRSPVAPRCCGARRLAQQKGTSKMDEIAEYNRQRWAELVRVNALFTRPWLDLDETSARAILDPARTLGDVRGKNVLCLAGGGGQQSVAFALLGASVTVVDLSDDQLQRDREAASHYSLQVTTLQGDMRDLAFLSTDQFDIVWHPYSLNFVPDCGAVFQQVARVIRTSGMYHFMAANPFLCGLGTRDWNGRAYELKNAYVEGAALEYRDEDWVYARKTAESHVPGPVEYRQTLGRIINSLVEAGFVLAKALEWSAEPPPLDAEPGTWDHLRLHAPPWIRFWAIHRPDLGLVRWMATN